MKKEAKPKAGKQRIQIDLKQVTYLASRGLSHE
jgi:hypothetical protein